MNEGISALLGIFMPIAVQYLNRYINFPDEAKTKFVKQLIAVIFSIVIGFLVSFFTKQLDPANLMASIGIVYTTANITYKQHFQKLGAK
jgi:hypothetical protein